MYQFPVRFKPDTNGTLLVTFPDVPEAITFGENQADAMIRAAEALVEALSLYIAGADGSQAGVGRTDAR